MFDGKSILVTGGTGSFGKKFIKNLEFKTSIPTNNQPSKNNYLGECKELSNLMKFFTESANAFAKQIYNINEPLYITQCWANKLIKGAVVGEHSHQNSIISGVFYLQLNLVLLKKYCQY